MNVNSILLTNGISRYKMECRVPISFRYEQGFLNEFAVCGHYISKDVILLRTEHLFLDAKFRFYNEKKMQRRSPFVNWWAARLRRLAENRFYFSARDAKSNCSEPSAYFCTVSLKTVTANQSPSYFLLLKSCPSGLTTDSSASTPQKIWRTACQQPTLLPLKLHHDTREKHCNKAKNRFHYSAARATQRT